MLVERAAELLADFDLGFDIHKPSNDGITLLCEAFSHRSITPTCAYCTGNAFLVPPRLVTASSATSITVNLTSLARVFNSKEHEHCSALNTNVTHFDGPSHRKKVPNS